MSFGKFSRNYQNLSPSELNLSIEHEKFIELVSKIGISANLINTFDNWIFGGILEKQISFKTFPLQYGNITFKDIKVNKPTYELKGIHYPLTPKIARENNLTYSGLLQVKVIFTPNDTNFPEQSKILDLGNITIMLGSKCCHLHGKTPEELIRMGECPNDPLGYFIIKGTEKIINIQEKIKTSQIFTFKIKEGYISQLTCVLPIGTTKIDLYLNKDEIFEVGFQTLKDKSLELFILFDLLLYEIVEDNSLDNVVDFAINLILKYTDEKYAKQIKYLFNISLNSLYKQYNDKYRFYKRILEMKKMGELIENGSTYRNFIDECNIFEDVKKINIEGEKSIYSNKYTFKELKEKLDSIILYKELFPHILTPSENKEINGIKLSDENNIKLQKANLLAYMTAHNCQCQLGKECDNKDNWMNKRLVTAGTSIELFFNSVWEAFIKGAIEKNINLNFTNTTCNFGNIFSQNLITDAFVSTFAPGNWGFKKNAKYKVNITDNMKRETSMSVISQIGRINTPRNSRTKDISIRSLQNTQLGYICCSETPEGEKCGLAKNICLTTIISLERPILDFEEYVKNFMSDGKITEDKTLNTPDLIIANGKIYGWCNKNIFLPFLKQKKREGKLPFDSCIYYNIYNKVLEYNCDASRLMRPLLNINPNTENLIIDEKELWKSSIDDLYKYQALELVDSREQDDIVVALSIKDYRNFINNKKEITFTKEKLQNKRKSKIDDKEYEYYKLIYSQDTQIVDIKEELSNFNSKTIGEVINSFEYSQKNFLSRFENFTVEELINLFNKYIKVKSTKLFNDIKDEFKIDDLISDFLIEKYTHCEFDPISLYGIASSLIPKSDSNQGPRTVYQASMCKQALGPYHFNRHLRFDTNFKCLKNPQRPIFESFLSEVYGLNIMPTGQNPIVAYLAMDANNEDAIVCKKEYIDAGYCDYIKYITIKYESEISKNEVFKYPNINENFDKEKYIHISENGLPKIGAHIKRGDCILGKVIKNSSTKIEENNCLFAHLGEEGIVDRILVSKNNDGHVIFRLKLRQTRRLQCGDKLASRYSQKGTIGKILPAYMLPRITSGPNEGLVPDFFINPNSSISRMTQGKFKEFLCSKAALYANCKIDATAFHLLDFKYYEDILAEKCGDRYGDEILEHPNGLELKCKVFVAPCNYQCLKHHVDDKIQLRGGFECEYDVITRQPIKGRTNEGGLRCGEMERDCFISHGSTSILLDRMMVCTDKYITAFCKTCGTMAIANVKAKQSYCNFCEKNTLIGSVTLCYIFKLIINFLNAIGISVKLKLENVYTPGNLSIERFLK